MTVVLLWCGPNSLLKITDLVVFESIMGGAGCVYLDSDFLKKTPRYSVVQTRQYKATYSNRFKSLSQVQHNRTS